MAIFNNYISSQAEDDDVIVETVPSHGNLGNIGIGSNNSAPLVTESQPVTSNTTTPTTSNPSGNNSPAETPTNGATVVKQTEKQPSTPTDQKYVDASSASYSSGVFINDALALLDESPNEDIVNKSHFFQNLQRMKITVGALSKYTNNLKQDNIQKNVLWFDYKMSVLKIVLEDTLNNMGINGYMEMHNLGSYADIMLHRHNSFYIVLNITLVNSEKITTKLEPYIFEISNVENLSSPTDEDRKIRLHLTDIMTAVCSNHHIATLLKLTNGSIATHKSYKAVFADILDYIKTHIKVNMLGEYDFRKDLFYTDDMMMNEMIRKENDVDESTDNEDMTELVKASFARMPQDATILEAIHILQQDCGRTLKTPKSFSQIYQTAGDLIVPFFFKEEYQVVMPHYGMVWVEPESESATTIVSEAFKNLLNGKFKEATQDAKNLVRKLFSQRMCVNKNYGGKETQLIYRNMTMRDIYMPFFLAFADKKTKTEMSSENYIFESINPEVDEKNNYTDYELSFKTPPGYRRNVIIQGIQSFPYDANVVRKKWKNIVFVDTVNSTTSVLIFLRWFYNYFCSVFLNNNMTGMIQFFPNLLPSFLAKTTNYGVGEATGEGTTFNALYDSHNSNIFICRTSDSRNEALREMGKNIASFILSNNRYILKMDGDIFRRPNEIIKFTQFSGKHSAFSALNSVLTGSLNITGDPYTYLYVTDVKHVFQEDGYYNYVEGCKFCENFRYEPIVSKVEDINDYVDNSKIDTYKENISTDDYNSPEGKLDGYFGSNIGMA